MKQILIIDDDEKLGKLLVQYLNVTTCKLMSP